MHWRLTTDEQPNWTVCSADRFSRIAGVTRVQLAANPTMIAVLTEPAEQLRPARLVIEMVRMANAKR